jgi:NitT/TauT family transport system ATP-binding protein
MTDRAPAAGRAAEQPQHMHLGERLPDADIGRMEALLQMLVDDERDGRADLPQLGEESELTDQDLLPLAQALALLGFARLADADLHITELGRHYVNGTHTLRQQLLGQQLLENVPLAAHIRHSLEQAPSGELPEEPVLELLKDSLDAPTAERVLRTAIEWGRYGEVFEYNLRTGLIHLPAGEEHEAV